MPTEKLLTIEDIGNLFESYAAEVKNTPRKRMVFVGKDGDKEYEELERPLILEGFYLYCRKHASDVHHYFENTGERYNEYRGIVTHVREAIREDQLTGGMVGQYSGPLTSKLQHLVAKTEMDIKSEPRVFKID